jgi:DNA-binding MarR family transcriptional regulator
VTDRPAASEPPPEGDPVTFTLFNEVGIIEQLVRTRMSHALPEGLQVSHFGVLNHFARLGGEKSPAQLARAFQVTKGAMTNTVQKLERAGYVVVRPDGVDGRRKLVSLTPEGRAMRDHASAAVVPSFAFVTREIGAERLRAALPVLRDLRILLDANR